MLVGTECVPAVHRMEQISSEEGIGSLSENLMEALKSNPDVAKQVRNNTKGVWFTTGWSKKKETHFWRPF